MAQGGCMFVTFTRGGRDEEQDDVMIKASNKARSQRNEAHFFCA